MGRRKMLAGAAALAGATVVVGRGGRKKFTLPPDVAALFRDIGPGTRMGDCRVSEIHPVQRGAISVVLTHGAQSFQVDVLKRDAQGPRPVAETPSLALFMVNGGGGNSRTDEPKGLAVMALAHALTWREEQGAGAPALLTLRERSEQFAGGLNQVG
jgi:hypothetical protein